jgi:hypothetical protein
MSVHPRNLQDLSLAPVAVEIDGNLQRMRDKSPGEVAYELVVELNCERNVVERSERLRLVLAAATRNVTMHGWGVRITDDATRLRLDGGSVTLDLGLSASMAAYIEHGADAAISK